MAPDLGVGVEHSDHHAGHFTFHEALRARDLRVIAARARLQCRVDRSACYDVVAKFPFQCNVFGMIFRQFATVGDGKDLPVPDDDSHLRV
jgi:hypothetical protein